MAKKKPPIPRSRPPSPRPKYEGSIARAKAAGKKLKGVVRGTSKTGPKFGVVKSTEIEDRRGQSINKHVTLNGKGMTGRGGGSKRKVVPVKDIKQERNRSRYK